MEYARPLMPRTQAARADWFAVSASGDSAAASAASFACATIPFGAHDFLRPMPSGAQLFLRSDHGSVFGGPRGDGTSDEPVESHSLTVSSCVVAVGVAC